MIALEPDYGYYLTNYCGCLDVERFDAALREAVARVNSRVSHRNLLALSPDAIDAYRMAVCAIADDVDDPAVVSWSTGKASEHYADASIMGTNAIIDRYLAGTWLGSSVV